MLPDSCYPRRRRKTKTSDRNDLKLDTVVVLDSLSVEAGVRVWNGLSQHIMSAPSLPEMLSLQALFQLIDCTVVMPAQ